ncbi:MAG: WD40 repeat domain-containing protein, partial [Gemmataceae bacterium]
SVGHVDAEKLRVGGPFELPFPANGPIALSPDRKSLYAVGVEMSEGRLARVDLATLKAGPAVPAGLAPVAVACSPDWVVVQTSGGREPASLRFLSPDGKDLARWQTDQRPFVAGGRLYLSPVRMRVAPSAYDLGPKPPASMPEPSTGPMPAGLAMTEQAALVGKLLTSQAGDLFVLGGAAAAQPVAVPGDVPATGARTLPALVSRPDRATAVASAGGDLLVGRSGGVTEFWVPAEGRVAHTAESAGTVLGAARGAGLYAVSIPGGARADLAALPNATTRTLIGPARPLGGNALAFLADGARLLGATEKGLTVWAVQPGFARIEKSIDVASPVTAVAASGGGLACGTMDGVVRTYLAGTFEPRHEMKGHAGEVRAVLLSRDGRRAFSAGVDGKVIVWDAEAGKAVRTIDAHDHVVTCLALSPDEALLVSGSLDGSARGWEVETGKLTKRFNGVPAEPVMGLAFVRDGAELAAAAGSRVRRWDLGPGKMPPAAPAPAGGVLEAKRMLPFRDAVIDAKAGYGFFVTTSTISGLRRFAADSFLPAGTYRLDQPVFRLLLDRGGKRLYAIRSGNPVNAAEYPPRGTDVELLAFDVNQLPGEKGPSKRVEPAARKKLGGTVLCPVLT